MNASPAFHCRQLTWSILWLGNVLQPNLCLQIVKCCVPADAAGLLNRRLNSGRNQKLIDSEFAKIFPSQTQVSLSKLQPSFLHLWYLSDKLQFSLKSYSGTLMKNANTKRREAGTIGKGPPHSHSHHTLAKKNVSCLKSLSMSTEIFSGRSKGWACTLLLAHLLLPSNRGGRPQEGRMPWMLLARGQLICLLGRKQVGSQIQQICIKTEDGWQCKRSTYLRIEISSLLVVLAWQEKKGPQSAICGRVFLRARHSAWTHFLVFSYYGAKPMKMYQT